MRNRRPMCSLSANLIRVTVSALLIAWPVLSPRDLRAQESEDADTPQSAETSTPAMTFSDAAGRMDDRLDTALGELAALRERIVAEKVPLSDRLAELERELIAVRGEFQEKSRTLDSRTLDLANLRKEIEQRQAEASYLSNLLGEYGRNLEARLHVAEKARYEGVIERAQLATEDSELPPQAVYEAQTALVHASLERLEELLGGVSFEGQAVDSQGMVRPGTFFVLGPAALFHDADGSVVGAVEQRLGSAEPTVMPFRDKLQAQAARSFFAGQDVYCPLDVTLGKAHLVEETQASLWEHIQQGGPVMVPIFILAGASLLVSLIKWIGLTFLRTPSPRSIEALLEAVRRRDAEEARRRVKAIPGSVGHMLTVGVEQMHHPRELIEEVMYEYVLATRLKAQRFLPFIAITAASAPLLGLLGTVTGIINTFQMITVFGTGDVKTLSGGISEALVTTEFGLIVAIPSLLLHAWLSRKARGYSDLMERAAVAFANEVDKCRQQAPAEAA